MTPAAQAREKVKMTQEQAAKQARICVSYLRRIERSGGCSYPLATRLARIYRCSANVFLMKTEGRQTPAGSNEKKKQPDAANVGH